MSEFTDRYVKSWADLVIVGVHHQGPGRTGPIISYDVRADLGDRLGAEVNITLIEALIDWATGKTFCTATLVDGKWRYGAPVVPQLRTIPDCDPSNNLGELPGI